MIKNINSDGKFLSVSKNEVYGGVDLNFYAGYQLIEIMQWWEKWGPMFSNPHPTVQEALTHAQTLHAMTKQEPAVSVGP